MVSALFGPNRFALLKAVQKTRDEFISKNGELAVELFDGEESTLEDIQSAVKSISLFTPSKLVIVRSATDNKQLVENIEELLDLAEENADLLLVDAKPDKRSVFYKTLKKRASVTEFPELDESSLSNWIMSEAKSHGAELSRGEAQYLVARVGTNQAQLYGELQKLIDHNKKITRSHIEMLVEPKPQDSVFDLLDSIFTGNTERSYQLYDSLRVGGSQPQMIIAMILWQLHLMNIVAHAGDRLIDDISADSGAKPYGLRKSQAIASKLGKSRVRLALRELLELDQTIKTKSVDPDDALKNYLSRLATSS